MYNAPFGLSVGGQFYVRSGHPTSKLGYYNSPYPDLLYVDTRGTAGDTPTDYEANLSLAYNINIGPVTVTPQFYVFNLLNRQTANNIDERFNPGRLVRDRSDEPILRSGGCPARDSASGRHDLHRHQALLGQPGLSEGGRPDRDDSRKNRSRAFPACLESQLLGFSHFNLRGGFGRPFFSATLSVSAARA